MIELCFGESLAGSLQYAIAMKKDDTRFDAAAVGVIGGTRKERAQALREARKPKPWQGEPLDISPADVFSLSLTLDWGDLSDLPERRETLHTLMGEYDGMADTMLLTNEKTMRRLADARENGEPVRAWVFPQDAYDLCGLYFLCDFFRSAKTPLFLVELPTCEARDDNTWTEYRGAGDVPPERLGGVLKNARPVSAVERRASATRWRELLAENAPLRAFVNGRVMSVPADFYDFAIRRNLPEGEFVLAHVIGKTLADLPCVGDRPLYLRLKAMEARGEITLVTPAEKDDTPYAAVYRKA